MAKDDYDKLVCLILLYLYDRIRDKRKEEPEAYRAKHSKITIDNYADYIRETSEKSRKKLAIEGYNAYTVDRISRYSGIMGSINRFDECEAEHMTKKMLGRK